MGGIYSTYVNISDVVDLGFSILGLTNICLVASGYKEGNAADSHTHTKRRKERKMKNNPMQPTPRTPTNTHAQHTPTNLIVRTHI